MLCGPLSSNTKLPLAMPSHLLQFDARNMYSSLKHRDQQQQHGPHFTRSEVGLRSDAKTDYGRFPIAIAVTTNSSSSRDAQFRLLQKRFSSLCEIGVIKETDASDRPDAISRGQKNTAAANEKTRGYNTVENPATNRKSRTEVSLYLGRSPSLSAEANTYDKKVVVERPSEETIAPSQLNTSELQYSKPFTSAITRRASVQHISSFVKQKVNTDRGGIKIRKMSAPSQSLGILINHNRSASLESLGKTTDNRYNDTDWNTLDDTQLQWEKLVARARSFQTHLTSSPVPERAHSRFDRKDNKEARTKTENVAQIQAVAEDDEISEDGSELSDVSSEASHTSNSSSSASGSTTCLTETFGLLAKPITKSSNPESESEKQVTEETETTKGETDVTESVNASLDNDKTVKNNETIEDNSVASHRRFSLATLRPQTESVERISGYSTHGALEYAKKLLGRIQTEGKTKTKKERLEGMSKALKLVLEELNRIESPDRELVSLFISLRAKIVNLRAELKNEESDGSGDEKQSEKTRVGISQTVPSPDEGNRDNLESPSHARRFSWC